MPKRKVTSGVRSAAQKSAQLKAAKASAAKRRKYTGTPVGRAKTIKQGDTVEVLKRNGQSRKSPQLLKVHRVMPKRVITGPSGASWTQGASYVTKDSSGRMASIVANDPQRPLRRVPKKRSSAKKKA